jgi:hypothetical protein
MTSPPAAFYCVSGDMYFLGAVGLVNSLRLVGHDEPIFLLDHGLSRTHRELLAPHVELVPAPRDAPPYLLKTFAPLRHPARVRVLVDADMIVTRPLHELIERASNGAVVAFENDTDRWVPEWGELLELGAISRRRYVSSALVTLGGSLGDRVLRLVDDRQRRVEPRLAYGEGIGAEDYPLLYLEQDVLNAVLAACSEPDRVETRPARLAPIQPFTGLRVQDLASLRCAYGDGTEPYALHYFHIRKPWLERMYHDVYSRLLARLLLGDDVAIRVPEHEVPLRMRDGLLARVERKRADLQDLARWYARDVIPERIAALRRRRATHRHP